MVGRITAPQGKGQHAMVNRDGASDDGAIMEIPDMARAIEWQARACEGMGAPATARVVAAELAVLASDTACGERMRGWPGLALEDAVPLRLAGGLHNLHMTGREARLAPVYAGTVSEQAAVDAIVLAVVRDHDEALLDWFERAPQTNEAGRAACVMAALLWLGERVTPRFELGEIGASAGINTMLGRFGFDLGGVRAGSPDSAIRLAPEWRGPPPPAGEIAIVASRGSDIAPIDLTDPPQAERLKSYAWPELAVRLARIDAAVAMAAHEPPAVAQADAADWIEQRLAEPQPDGVTRVLFHTIMWQYLPLASRERIERAMAAAGARATVERPLAWVRFETSRETFRHEISARYWPGGEEWTLLGSAQAHGAWIEWLGDEPAH